MPRRVDHRERKEEVVAAAWRVIAQAGIEAASLREIAREAGVSTGVISHYFRDKNDVLMSAVRLVAEREKARQESATSGLRGLAALRAAARAILPLDEEQITEATVWITFWSQAVGSAELAAEQRLHYVRWRSRLTRHLGEAVADGELSADVDPATEAIRIAALMDGISVQALLEPGLLEDHGPAGLLDGYLAALSAPVPAGRRLARRRRAPAPPRPGPSRAGPRVGTAPSGASGLAVRPPPPPELLDEV